MLKKILVALSGTMLFASALAQTTIKGTIEEKDTKGYLYLYEYLGRHPELIDSANIKKGKFSFKKEYPTGQYELKLKAHSIQIIVEGEELALHLKSSPNIRVKSIEGSQATFEYQFYKKHNDSFDKQIQNLNKEASKYAYIRQTDPAQYNTLINGLRQKWDSLQTSHNVYMIGLADKVSSPFIKDIANMLKMDVTNNTKNSYLTKADFTDNRFARGEFLTRKINTYFLQLAQLSPQNYQMEMNNLLSYTTKNTLSREVVYETIVATSVNFNMETSKQYAKNYLGEFPTSKYAKEWVSQFPVDVGDQFKEIELLGPDRTTVYKLSDLKGKVILLDFWASWCGPCIAEMPNVVNAYEKYHDQGFEVYSVSLDGNANSWKGAIKRFNMKWPYHVSSLKKWQCPSAAGYGVRGIPFTMLIDKDGKIIAKGLRGPVLHQKLDEIFSK